MRQTIGRCVGGRDRAITWLVAAALAWWLGCGARPTPVVRPPGEQTTQTAPPAVADPGASAQREDGPSPVAATSTRELGSDGSAADAASSDVGVGEVATDAVGATRTIVPFASLPRHMNRADPALAELSVSPLDGAYDLHTDRGIIHFDAPEWKDAFSPTIEEATRLDDLDARLAWDDLPVAEREALRAERDALRQRATRPTKSIGGSPDWTPGPDWHRVSWFRAYHLYHPSYCPSAGRP